MSDDDGRRHIKSATARNTPATWTNTNSPGQQGWTSGPWSSGWARAPHPRWPTSSHYDFVQPVDTNFLFLWILSEVAPSGHTLQIHSVLALSSQHRFYPHRACTLSAELTMLVSPAPKPISMSKPLFKRTVSDTLRPDDYPSRSVSPAGSFYGDGLRPQDLPLRAASTASSFYSHYSSSSPSIESASSSGSRSAPPLLPALALGSSWLMRAPRPPRPTLNVVSSVVSDFASPPDTPVDVPEAELRRRQLEKATRILGESVPLELVFQQPLPLVTAFPDPPPRRSTESPQPGLPREMLTQRRTGKLARRASLSLTAFTSKFRSSSKPMAHSRDSSHDSSSSSEHSQHSRDTPTSAGSFIRIIPRRRSLILSSPILFAFPGRSPTRAQTLPAAPDELVLDIRSSDSPTHGHGEEEATPIREHPARSHNYSASEFLPRIVPVPTHTHTKSEHLHARPETPFADYIRPETPFSDLRPATPFEDLARPTTPMVDLPADEAEDPAYLNLGVSRKERGQGWSGEWNQNDMQNVIHKLRSLK
ncbi:hypothetical protein C8F04DRAFT_573649 [Mycena alexandri]|uniref:Uncharacterized protein n=1 Tax=Mycena alexandri TaxID=1745969 RepID=A0AAD6SWN9_9AGAR|nr:hypothetical protein C8F04DRAFT_573649 [Mycena alexandri]